MRYDTYGLAAASWEAERERACAEMGFGPDDEGAPLRGERDEEGDDYAGA